MEDLRVIWLLAIGLGLACLCGYLAQKLKQSPIIGYLFAGFLMGPYSPGFVADPYIADQLASVGITLLMFAIGLSFSWKDLIQVKKIAVPGALVLSGFSILAGLFYSYSLQESLLSGLVIGISICVSSTVVIVRVLSDRGLLHTKQGHLVVGWTIVEDLISISGLILLPALAAANFSSTTTETGLIFELLFVLVKVAALALIVYTFGETLIEKILKIIARTRSHELFTLAILSITFLIAIGSSHLFGVSLALGAFIAGVTIGKTDMSYQAAANAIPVRDAFAVIFFLSVGMLFNPTVVFSNLPLLLGILFILLVLRPLAAFCILKIARYPSSTALTLALAIAQIGEYSFIIAEEGSVLNILPDNAYYVLVAAAFITILLNPILFELFKISPGARETRYSNVPEELKVQHFAVSDSKSDLLTPQRGAIIVGFGPVGQSAAKELLKKGFRLTILDQNIDAITSLKSMNVKTIFGDATQFHILQQAGPENAELLVITTPEFSATQSIAQIALDINPQLKIIARSRYKACLTHHLLRHIPVICDEEIASEKLVQVLQKMIEEAV